MKLRLRGDAVRLRLTAGEVARLVSAGRVAEKSTIGPGTEGTLTYAVELSTETRVIEVSLRAGELLVLVPEKIALAWAQGEEEGIYSAPQAAGASVAVEKDFRCLTPRGAEDASDAYPHPREADATHDDC